MSAKKRATRAPKTSPATQLLLEMLPIPGKSGEEAAIQEFIRRRLIEAGLPAKNISNDTAHTKAGSGEVGNLIAKLPGTERGPRRLLMAHVDTVPICVGSQPVVENGFVSSADPQTGLGGDNRGGAAVVLNTALEILRQGLPHPPLTLFWPVQEEIGLVGARHVTKSQLGNPSLCVNFDGGEPNIVITGATGAIYMDIDVHGVASHAGAHPEDGVSAVAIASKAVNDLADRGWHGLIIKGRQQGTSNVGIFSGGAATNVVVNHVHVHAEARSHKTRFRQRIVEEFRKSFERAADQVKNINGQKGRIEFRSEQRYDSFRLKKTEDCVQTALAAVRAAGLPASTRIVNGGLDANWMVSHGFPTVTLGCGQADIHTVNESLYLENYERACDIALKIGTGAV